MIASFFEGRVRLRANALKKVEIVGKVVNLLQNKDGIVRCNSNLRTGSLVVEYDPQKISHEDLTLAAEFLRPLLEEPAKSTPAKSCYLRKLISPKGEMYMMGASAVGTLGGLIVTRRLHMIAGSVFFLCAAYHAYRRVVR